MKKRNLSPGQWLFVTGFGISVVCAWAWFIRSALAASALATIALAPRHLALLNMEGVRLKQQRAILLAQRQTADKA